MDKKWFLRRIIIVGILLVIAMAFLFFYERFVSYKDLYKERVAEMQKNMELSMKNMVYASNLIEYSDSIRKLVSIHDTSRMNREIYRLYFNVVPDLYRIHIFDTNGDHWQLNGNDSLWFRNDSLQIADILKKFPENCTDIKWSRYYIENGQLLVSVILMDVSSIGYDNYICFDFYGGQLNENLDYKHMGRESFAFMSDNSDNAESILIVPFGKSYHSFEYDTSTFNNYNRILKKYLTSVDSLNDNDVAEFTYNNDLYYVGNSTINMNGNDINFGVVLSVKELVKEYRSSTLVISIALLIVVLVYIYVIISGYIRYKYEIDDDDKVDKLIKKGESAGVEFKSSLRWDYVDGKVNKALEEVIMKTLAAFNNSEGGRLFIGVKDDGMALGLESDYQTLKNTGKDYFELHLRSLITSNYGIEFCTNGLSVRFPEYNGIEICEIKIHRGITPLYTACINKSGCKDEKFYVRSGNSSREIDKPSEIIDYINKRFGNMRRKNIFFRGR